MSRPRTWTDQQLRDAVRASRSWSEAASRLGIAHAHRGVIRRADELGIDRSHFTRDGMIDTRPRIEDDSDHFEIDHWHLLDRAHRNADNARRRFETVVRRYIRAGATKTQIAQRLDISVADVVRITRGDA